jgi:hypothetical protein
MIDFLRDNKFQRFGSRHFGLRHFGLRRFGGAIALNLLFTLDRYGDIAAGMRDEG